jgi:hypothetical protein
VFCMEYIIRVEHGFLCPERYVDQCRVKYNINMLCISFHRQWMDKMCVDVQLRNEDMESTTKDKGVKMEMTDSRGHGGR